MRIDGPDAERLRRLQQRTLADRAAAAAERADAEQLLASAELIHSAADHRAGLPSETERQIAGITAGRWDRDPVRPNPGDGTWIDPGPAAAPEPDDSPVLAERKSGGKCDPRRTIAGLAPAASSPEDKVRWSADVRQPTVNGARPGAGRPW